MANFFGDLFGSNESGYTQDQIDALERARQEYSGVQNAKFTPVQYKGLVGDQAHMEASQIGDSAYNNISLDPRLKDVQMEQLSALKELRDNGGLNASDKANLAGIQNTENMNTRGQREAILQNANMRGMSSNGNSMVAQMMAEQGAANRQSQKDLNIAGMAQDRALSAGNSAATQAGNMSQRDFEQQSATAAANDAIAKANAGFLNNASQYNAGLRQQTGLAGAQAWNNQQTMNNYTQPQSTFSNDMSRANGVAGVDRSQAENYGNQAALDAKTQGNMMSGALKIGGAVAGGMYGGPQGAAAGYQMGGAAGQMVGGSSDQNDQLDALSNLRKKQGVNNG